MNGRPADLDEGWDEVPDSAAHDPGRRPTPWPSFDLAAFARESETNLLAADESSRFPTAPPPPFHPASLRPRVSHIREIGESIGPALRARIIECTERTQLARTQLRIGGLSREEAARALATELRALEGEAARSGSTLAQLTVALRTAIEELAGIVGDAPGVPFEVIVLDERSDTRARVALAVESLGHVARVAANLTELALLAARRVPDAIFVAVSIDGGHQPESCTLLREVVRSESAAVVVFAAGAEVPLAEVAHSTGATHWFRVDEEIEVMMEALNDIFGAMLL